MLVARGYWRVARRLYALWFVLVLLLLPLQISSFRQKPKGLAVVAAMNGPNQKNESTVLRELKETIAKQTKEIESLKSQLAQNRTPAAPKQQQGGHGAHGGGGPDMQADEYMKLPFYRIASHRVGWLSLFLCSLSLTALIMNGFENTLHRQLELAYFVPYVVACQQMLLLLF